MKTVVFLEINNSSLKVGELLFYSSAYSTSAYSTKYLFLLSGVVKFRELLANTRFFSIGLKVIYMYA
jgi:hypothetical protein